MKINKLEIEIFKRVKAVKLEPTKNGLTIVGGNNRQGKTSVLDAIAWALGGNKFRPVDAWHKDSVIPPRLHVVMDNGLVVERVGKNSSLKVIDPDGNKGGQALLDSFIEELALDLPKFMAQSDKEKGRTLLQIIGVGEKLAELELKENETYNQRRTIGQIADQKAKFAKEQPYYPDAPKEPVSASELIREQQAILAKNGENQKHRHNLQELIDGKERTQVEYDAVCRQIEELTMKRGSLGSMLKEYEDHIGLAQKTVDELQDESTEELEVAIDNVEGINVKVRANLDKDKAEQDAAEYRAQYDELTASLTSIRDAKTKLLEDADLPLEGLTVADGVLRYKGYTWGDVSGSEQLKVATAIVRKLNPQCQFVLLDKLEQMDLDTLEEFGKWLEQEGLQAIATRVSTGGECSVIIEDGYISSRNEAEPKAKYTAGKF